MLHNLDDNIFTLCLNVEKKPKKFQIVRTMLSE